MTANTLNYTTSCRDASPEEVRATVKTLRAWARKVPTAQRGCHWQIAKRRIADAALFADRNTEHAAHCCWEARTHLGFCRDAA